MVIGLQEGHNFNTVILCEVYDNNNIISASNKNIFTLPRCDPMAIFT
jgi:hypothetical protein